MEEKNGKVIEQLIETISKVIKGLKETLPSDDTFEATTSRSLLHGVEMYEQLLKTHLENMCYWVKKYEEKY